MLIRIRFGGGPKAVKKRGKNHRFALVVAVLLKPAAAAALVLACWGFAAQFNWATRFAIPSGPFSYWQVWLGAAALLQICSHYLNRSAKDERGQASERP
jgi:hypothetical protein